METNWLLNASVPLGGAGNMNTPMLAASMNHAGSGKSGEQLGLSGSQGYDNQYSYGLNTSYLLAGNVAAKAATCSLSCS